MPSEFEFNADLLLFLADVLYTGKYGTFFCNSEYERKQAKLKQTSVSVWLEVNLRKDTDFKNPYFQGRGNRLTEIPETDYHKLRVWREYFFSFSDGEQEPGYIWDNSIQLDDCTEDEADLTILLE
jgi:hypothetical protein